MTGWWHFYININNDVGVSNLSVLILLTQKLEHLSKLYFSVAPGCSIAFFLSCQLPFDNLVSHIYSAILFFLPSEIKLTSRHITRLHKIWFKSMITNTVNASGWQMLCSVHTFYFEHIGMQHAHNMHSSFLVESMVMACVFPSSLQTLWLPSTMLGLLLTFVMLWAHCSRAVAILDVITCSDHIQ